MFLLLAQQTTPETPWMALSGILTVLLGAIGGAVTWVYTKYRELRKESQEFVGRQEADRRAHDDKIMGKIEGLATQFNVTAKEIQAANAATQERQFNTLLQIQHETVEAVGGLSGEVSKLGGAIDQLKTEVAKKADRN